MPLSLVQPFLDRVAVPLRPAFASMIDLEGRLESLLIAGRAQWPSLAVEPHAFVAFVAARLPDDRAADDALRSMHVEELYLTFACTCGSTAALVAFDRHYMGEVDLALRRMRISAPQVDEIKQMVRHKLFVAEDGATGKISEYSGRGDLRRWVRSIAVRTYLNDLRRGHRMVPTADDQLLQGMSSSEDDPELAYMKERYRNEFRDAFIRAVGQLGAREQNLLRYHHIDGLNIDEIGAIYRVHRVTAYRWLEKARETLVAEIQKILEARLQMEQRDFNSMLRLIRSQLHLSLVKYLGGPTAPEPGESAVQQPGTASDNTGPTRAPSKPPPIPPRRPGSKRDGDDA